MKLSVALSVLAATAATTTARLHIAKNDSRKLQGGDDMMIMCPMNYDPVCGSDYVTYGNSCQADAAGATILSQGECPKEPVNPTEIPVISVGAEDDMMFCPENYAPVCGADGRTYSNSCKARVAGMEVAHEGECEKPPVISVGAEDDMMFCPENYAPVCGADGRTYSNSCKARVAGVEVVSEGECEKPSVISVGVLPEAEDDMIMCPMNYDPVCGSDNVTYGNSCQADAAGATIVSQGECEKPQVISVGVLPEDEEDMIMCPANYAPVCGADGRTYSNSCKARVAGVEVASEGECEKPPVTEVLPIPEPCLERNFAPVCGFDGVTYDNECLAVAAGTIVVSKGDCPQPCTEEYMPVCGVDGVTYDNTCYAKRAGVTIASKGECEATEGIPVMEVAIEDTESTEVSPSDNMVDAEPAAAATGDDGAMISSASSAVLSSAAVLAVSALIFVAV